MNIKYSRSYNQRNYTGTVIHTDKAGFNLDGIELLFRSYDYVNGAMKAARTGGEVINAMERFRVDGRKEIRS